MSILWQYYTFSGFIEKGQGGSRPNERDAASIKAG
jgi:hypothetical protein